MAGRKALVLTLDDVKDVIRYIEDLPFKRKIQERFLVMVQGKKNMLDFTAEDLDLVKKCRYEMNAHKKQIQALESIRAQPTHSSFEQDILGLAVKPDIDSYFLMLDALKTYLRKVDQKLAETKLKNDKRRMERKEDDAKSIARKQRDRENYFLGASLRKLLEVTEVFPNKDDLLKLCTVVNSARLVDLLIQTQAIDMKLYNQKLRDSERGREFAQTVTEIIEDPRNPFRKQ